MYYILTDLQNVIGVEKKIMFQLLNMELHTIIDLFVVTVQMILLNITKH